MLYIVILFIYFCKLGNCLRISIAILNLFFYSVSLFCVITNFTPYFNLNIYFSFVKWHLYLIFLFYLFLYWEVWICILNLINLQNSVIKFSHYVKIFLMNFIIVYIFLDYSFLLFTVIGYRILTVNVLLYVSLTHNVGIWSLSSTTRGPHTGTSALFLIKTKMFTSYHNTWKICVKSKQTNDWN